MTIDMDMLNKKPFNLYPVDDVDKVIEILDDITERLLNDEYISQAEVYILNDKIPLYLGQLRDIFKMLNKNIAKEAMYDKRND